MSDPLIHGNKPAFSASLALAAIGKALGEIKAQDGLTWADMGALLGKSEDQVAKYAEGTATMDAITFARGKREWNGRFTGYLDRLCIESRPGRTSDCAALTAILRASCAIAEAKENDGEIYDWEILRDRSVLENARDVLEELLRRVKPE